MRPVFLIGFMAAGKTTVGKLVAERLALPFVDLDDAIVQKEGCSVAEIFARDGEAGFRQREASVIAALAAGPPAVVATGGGAAVDPANLTAMRRRGLVVSLGVSLETALARAAGAGGRPLLERPAAEIAALYRGRAPVYRRGHAAIDTEGRPVAAVAAEIVDLVRRAGMLGNTELGDAALIALGERSYPVVVAAGALARVAERVMAVAPGVARVAVVTDENVGPLHAGRVIASLTTAGLAVSRHTVAAGETAKSGAGFLALAEELIAAGLDRSSLILGLGGGVVGDLCGFVAATLFRGVPVVHLPTTLLAMIDSAIGGKTGINTPAGKNLIGAFWQPRLVIADPAVLATLPLRERRAAFGELAKYALLDGESLHAEVEAAAVGWTRERTPGDPSTIAGLIGRAAAIKAAIVSRDERELRGERQLLNLGHTLGHAIEAAAGFAGLLHGEAVALGLVAAARVSAALGVAPSSLEARVAATLARAGLSTDLQPWLRPDVVARIKVDKKRSGGDIAFVTVAGPGDCAVLPLSLVQLGQILAASP